MNWKSPIVQPHASHRAGIKPTDGVEVGRIRTRFSQPYTAARGRYDVEVRYSDEQGRRSRFALIVKGVTRGAHGSQREQDKAGRAIRFVMSKSAPATRSAWT